MRLIVEHRQRRIALMQKARETKKSGTENWVSYWVYLARKENKNLVRQKNAVMAAGIVRPHKG